MHSLWRLLDPADLDGSFDAWLSVVEPMIQASRQTSASLAAAYLTTARTLAVGPDHRFTPVIAGPASSDALRTSMLVTGPVAIKAGLGRGARIGASLDIAEARSAAAAMRHALNGGRETVTLTLQADHRTVGYQRVTSGNPCNFCADLADRGAVYGGEGADFQAHDGCSCSAEPVFR